MLNENRGEEFLALNKFGQTVEGVNRFLVHGPSNLNRQIKLDGLIAIFNSEDLRQTALVALKFNPGLSHYALLREGLDIQSDVSLPTLAFPDDNNLRQSFSRKFAVEGLPYIMMGISNMEKPKQKGVFICSIAGYSPQSALAEIQGCIKAYLRGFN